MPFHIIAHTYAERKEVLKFWEEMRKEAELIRDEYDKVNDEKYHKKFYKKNKEKRPDFLEPFP